jgi:hypothetical protein
MARRLLNEGRLWVKRAAKACPCRRQLSPKAAMAAPFPRSRRPSNGMSTRPRSQPGPPMTLGNMRANGVRWLAVSCHLCHHQAVLSADPWADDMPVPSFGPRMVCSRAVRHRGGDRWGNLMFDKDGAHRAFHRPVSDSSDLGSIRHAHSLGELRW